MCVVFFACCDLIDVARWHECGEVAHPQNKSKMLTKVDSFCGSTVCSWWQCRWQCLWMTRRRQLKFVELMRHQGS